MRDHFPHQSPFSHFRGRCLEDIDAGSHSGELQCFSCSTRASSMTLSVDVFEISITEPTAHPADDRIYNVFLRFDSALSEIQGRVPNPTLWI